MNRPGPVAIGIDPSSAKLVAVIGPTHGAGPIRVKVQKLSPDHAQGAAEAYNFAYELMEDAHARGVKVPRIALEAPVLGKGGAGSTIPQCFISGGLQAAFTHWADDGTLFMANNQSWKKKIVGIGNASKDQITEWVLTEHPEWVKQWGHTPRGMIDQDVMDAICLYLFACVRVSLDRKINRLLSKEDNAAA